MSECLFFKLCFSEQLFDRIAFCAFDRQRIPKHQWWLKLRPLLRILAKHDSTYEEEGMYITVEEELSHDGVL